VFQAEQHAEHIDVEGSPIVFLGLLVDRKTGRAFGAGVVERVMDSALGFQRELHERLHVGLDAGVCLEESRNSTGRLDGFDDRLSLGCAASGNDDFGATGGEFVGDIGPDATRGTGDESNFVLEGSFHGGLFFAAVMILCRAFCPTG
jgi:hypothetical protein